MEVERRPRPSIADLERTRFELLLEAGSSSDRREYRRIHAELQQIDAAVLNGVALDEALRDLPQIWDAIYGDGVGYLALFSGRRTSRALAEPRSAYFSWPDASSEAARWSMTESAIEREVYQCAHLLTHPRRRKHFAARLSSLYVDLDTDALPPPQLQPTVTVASSPGRFQCYFRLAEPVPPSMGESLNRRLAVALAADRSGWDLTQLLRVPGTRNHKYADGPRVRLVEIASAVYQPHDLDALLPPLASTVRRDGREEGAAGSLAGC